MLRCYMCGEIFCGKCVTRNYNSILDIDTGETRTFCSGTCMGNYCVEEARKWQVVGYHTEDDSFKLTPLYNCDFCVKPFTGDEMRRCHTCGQVYCNKCVTKGYTMFDDDTEQTWRFCTDECIDKYLVEEARKWTIVGFSNNM
jgi:hypothetical protein